MIKKKDPYNMRVIGKNKLLVTAVNLDYAMIYERQAFLNCGLPDYVDHAMDNARYRFKQNIDNLKFQEYEIEFPSHYELSSQVIYDKSGKAHKAELGLIGVEYARYDGAAMSNIYAHWTVARVDGGSLMVGDIDEEESDTMKLLNFSGGGKIVN